MPELCVDPSALLEALVLSVSAKGVVLGEVVLAATLNLGWFCYQKHGRVKENESSHSGNRNSA